MYTLKLPYFKSYICSYIIFANYLLYKHFREARLIMQRDNINLLISSALKVFISFSS